MSAKIRTECDLVSSYIIDQATKNNLQHQKKVNSHTKNCEECKDKLEEEKRLNSLCTGK